MHEKMYFLNTYKNHVSLNVHVLYICPFDQKKTCLRSVYHPWQVCLYIAVFIAMSKNINHVMPPAAVCVCGVLTCNFQNKT